MFKNLITYRDQIYLGMIITLIISFPLSYAINSIAMFLFVPFFFLDYKSRILEKIKRVINNKINLLYILLFLAQVIGLLYSDNFDYGLKRVSVMLPMLFLPAIVSVESITKKQFNFILSFTTYYITLFFITYLLIHLFIDGRDINTFVHFTISEKLDISQFYLMFILFIPIIVSINAIMNKNRIVFHIILLSISLGIVLLLGNKTSVFFMLLIWVILIIQTYRRNKAKTLIPIVMGSFLFIVAFQLPIINQRIDVFTKTLDFDMETIITKNSFTITKNTFEHRILINYLATKEILNAFPFGVGTGDFQDVLNYQYKRINFKAAISSGLNNHNQYLAEFLKTGLLGGILFLLLIFTLLKRIKLEQKYFSYFIVFFSLACMAESYLDRQHGIVIFAFLIPFFLYNDKND